MIAGIAGIPLASCFESLILEGKSQAILKFLAAFCCCVFQLPSPGGVRRPKDDAVQPPTIKSLGPPPERHADRVTADMIRFLIAERESAYPRIEAGARSLLWQAQQQSQGAGEARCGRRQCGGHSPMTGTSQAAPTPYKSNRSQEI